MTDPNEPPPTWFTVAVGAPHRRVETVVDGATVRAHCWDPPDGTEPPTLVLLHGGAAHAGWWNFLAPAFLPGFRVLAVELSGHGDSDHRPRYDFPTWTREVLTLTEHVAAGAPVVVVGHSMGGVVAALAAQAREVVGVVLVDTPLHEPPQERIGDADAVFSRVRAHPSRSAALDRFRLLPDQPVLHPALLRHAAEHGIRSSDAGWVWKFDPRIFSDGAHGRPEDLGDVLAAVDVPVGAIVGGRSGVVPAEDRERLRALARRDGPAAGYREVVEGHHHLMFDQPLGLVEELASILARWRQRYPRVSVDAG